MAQSLPPSSCESGLPLKCDCKPGLACVLALRHSLVPLVCLSSGSAHVLDAMLLTSLGKVTAFEELLARQEYEARICSAACSTATLQLVWRITAAAQPELFQDWATIGRVMLGWIWPWQHSEAQVVQLALRALRAAVKSKVACTLRGDGDLVLRKTSKHLMKDSSWSFGSK